MYSCNGWEMIFLGVTDCTFDCDFLGVGFDEVM
jgi:hypothetical protein